MTSFIEVTALNGSKVHIVAAGVFRVISSIADPDQPTHVEIDFSGGMQRTDDPVAQVLKQLKDAQIKMIQLTAPNGVAVYLNAASISAIRSPLDGEYATGVQAVVTVGGHPEGVRETPDQVRAAM